MYTQTLRAKTKANKDARRSSSPSRHQHAHPILQLQRKYGNQVVQRMLQSGVIQAKLKIGQPNDKYEQEADRVADQVMRMPDPTVVTEQNHGAFPIRTPGIKKKEETIQTKLSILSEANILQRTKEEQLRDPEVQMPIPDEGQANAVLVYGQQSEEEQNETGSETVQRKVMDDSDSVIPTHLEHAFSNITTGGQPLPADINYKMSVLFGTDFSNIKIHNDQRAISLAESINSKAFTYNNHIYFAKDNYEPSTKSGQHLLAHELTHTIQQGAVTSNSLLSRSMNPNSISKVKPSIQRTIDLSIQFDTYSLNNLLGIVPLTGGPVSSVARDIERTAYTSFGARSPVTTMDLTDTWYYYNPLFTRSVYATRNYWLMPPSNYYYRANDVHRFRFNYRNTATRSRTGSFQVSSGTTNSRTRTVTGGAQLTYSVIQLSGSVSSATTSGSTAGTQVTTTNYYEHDYDVYLNYNISYYNDSDFVVRTTFWGPRMYHVSGPHTVSGTVKVGTCSVKDDDSNADNLTP